EARLTSCARKLHPYGKVQLDLINAGLEHEGASRWCIGDTRAEGDTSSISLTTGNWSSIGNKIACPGAGELACTEGCPAHINTGHGRIWRTVGGGGIKGQGLVSRSIRVLAVE